MGETSLDGFWMVDGDPSLEASASVHLSVSVPEGGRAIVPTSITGLLKMLLGKLK